VLERVSFPSPVGRLTALLSGGALACLSFTETGSGFLERFIRRWFPGEDVKEDAGAGAPVRRQLDEYFAGRRTRFDLQLDLRGTDYRRRVWRQLKLIGYGQTITYSQLADRAGGGARSAGTACGANPVSIIVPCHRVVGTDGALRGFGGGLHNKRFLLDLESGRLPTRECGESSGAR